MQPREHRQWVWPCVSRHSTVSHWHAGPEYRTDQDGRISEFDSPGPGVHRIRFDTGAYFAARGVDTFYPEVAVTFVVTDAASHYHVPLLLSPFAFSTYRGS